MKPFAFLLYISLAAPLLISTNTDAAVVLQYHHISDKTPPLTSISPKLFRQHMDYLAEQGFDVISSVQLEEWLASKNPRLDDEQARVAVITFDDGYDSVLEAAAPILAAHQWPFTVFINPSLVGNQGYLSWKDLVILREQGAVIANHTNTHPHLIRTKQDESHDQWQRRVIHEITQAQALMRKHLSNTPKQVAYPYGEYNQDIEAVLTRLGFIGFAQHSGAVGTSADPQALPRFAFGGQYAEMEGFIDKVNSLPMPVRAVTVTSNDGKPLQDPLLPQGQYQPQVNLTLERPLAVNCFATGQGAMEIKTQDKVELTVQADSPVPVGRSRYNCTAASNEAGRFYWLSLPFFRKNDDGSWYPEY